MGRHRAPGRLLSPEPTRLSTTHVHAGPAESSRSETEHPGGPGRPPGPGPGGRQPHGCQPWAELPLRASASSPGCGPACTCRLPSALCGPQATSSAPALPTQHQRAHRSAFSLLDLSPRPFPLRTVRPSIPAWTLGAELCTSQTWPAHSQLLPASLPMVFPATVNSPCCADCKPVVLGNSPLFLPGSNPSRNPTDSVLAALCLQV